MSTTGTKVWRQHQPWVTWAPSKSFWKSHSYKLYAISRLWNKNKNPYTAQCFEKYPWKKKKNSGHTVYHVPITEEISWSENSLLSIVPFRICACDSLWKGPNSSASCIASNELSAFVYVICLFFNLLFISYFFYFLIFYFYFSYFWILFTRCNLVYKLNKNMKHFMIQVFLLCT